MSITQVKTVTTLRSIEMIRLIVAVTLIMAAGWGIRGAFGHSRGAAMPGAMLGLSLAVVSMRADWWKRGAILGFLGAIGWAFAGTASYGLLVGYSQGGSWLNSAYGYAGLFVVGGLYGGIGGALLALGITAPRSLLDKFLWPMIGIYCAWLLLEWFGLKAWSLELYAKVADRPFDTSWLYDTLWLDAAAALLLSLILWAIVPRWRDATGLTALLSIAWFAGMALLIWAMGLRMNPSRGDAWAGCVGMLLAFQYWYWCRRNRVAIMLILYGTLSGGFGFVLGEFIQALGKAKWGPIGQFPVLQEFGYWTIMEQTLGGAMALGISVAMVRLIRGHLVAPVEDSPSSWFDSFAVFILLGVVFAFNFKTNYLAWLKLNNVTNETLTLPSSMVMSSVAIGILVLLSAAIYRQRRGYLDLAPRTALGKVQLLALLMTWMVMAIYMLLPRVGLPTSLMFFAELMVGTLLLILVRNNPVKPILGSERTADSSHWKLGWGHAAFWVMVPLLIGGVAWMTLRLELPVKQIRFPDVSPKPGFEGQ